MQMCAVPWQTTLDKVSGRNLGFLVCLPCNRRLFAAPVLRQLLGVVLYDEFSKKLEEIFHPLVITKALQRSFQ